MKKQTKKAWRLTLNQDILFSCYTGLTSTLYTCLYRWQYLAVPLGSKRVCFTVQGIYAMITQNVTFETAP